jgi:hypothetical protein
MLQFAVVPLLHLRSQSQEPKRVIALTEPRL